MNDALGNEIVIGQKYGYSAKDTVFVGTAVNFTATRVTLETIKRRFFRYGKEDVTWHERYPAAKTTSVPSFHLFPIKD
jgi:hypothetical protein